VKQTADCRLRWLRRRWGLTQKELAILLGDKSGTAVSRLECQERQPSLEAAFGCQVLFGVAPPDLFPSLFTEVEEDVVGRIRGLYDALEGSRCESSRVKRELCESVFAQVEARARQSS
jgi:transcriptional regulator with XRE-family HTH domain